MLIKKAPNDLTLMGLVALDTVKLSNELPVKFLFAKGLYIVTT